MFIQLNYTKNSVISDNAGTNPGVYKLFVAGFNDNVGNPAGDPPVAPDDANRVKRDIILKNIFYQE